MANGFNGLLSRIAPGFALKREVTQAQLELLQKRRGAVGGSSRSASAYAPVGGGRRSREFYRNSRDAQGALRGAREPLAFIARDMLRNNARVGRANNLFAGYTVGSGIRPVVVMKNGAGDAVKSWIEGLIEDHLLTTAFDADGHSTLFGHQVLAMKTIPTSGEVLLRRRHRRKTDGLPLPFQVQCLETDYIAAGVNTLPRGGASRIEDGVEYGPTGLPVAFHLYREHPGSLYGGGDIRRVTADNISHAFMVDRPGQRRGVSWYSAVMPELMDIHKFMQGTLKRQEVAAMFAGILKKGGDDDASGEDLLGDLEAGSILELEGNDELEFNDPPSALSAEPVVRLIDRTLAAGLMLTYEGFTGDYSNVNYTSGRMGRMDQDPVQRFWQEELVIAKQMARVSVWFKEAVYFQTGIEPDDYKLRWTAPRRPVVDPTKDWPALIKKIRGGLASRQSVIREAGEDPDRVLQEWQADAKSADDNGLVFDSDPRRTAASGGAQSSANKQEDGEDA